MLTRCFRSTCSVLNRKCLCRLLPALAILLTASTQPFPSSFKWNLSFCSVFGTNRTPPSFSLLSISGVLDRTWKRKEPTFFWIICFFVSQSSGLDYLKYLILHLSLSLSLPLSSQFFTSSASRRLNHLSFSFTLPSFSLISQKDKLVTMGFGFSFQSGLIWPNCGFLKIKLFYHLPCIELHFLVINLRLLIFIISLLKVLPLSVSPYPCRLCIV